MTCYLAVNSAVTARPHPQQVVPPAGDNPCRLSCERAERMSGRHVDSSRCTLSQIYGVSQQRFESWYSGPEI